MGSLCCKDVEQEKIYVGVSRRSYKDRKNTIYQQILQYQEASLEVVSPTERLYLKKKDSSDQSKYYSCVSEKDSRIIKSPKSESQNDFEMNIEESSFHINLGNFNPGTPLVKKQIIDEKEIIFKPATEVLGPSTSSSTINNIKSPENGPKLNMENYEKFGRQGHDPEEDKNEGEIFYEAKSSFNEEGNINESQKSP